MRLVSVTRPADPAVPNLRLPPEDARSLLNRLGPLPFGYVRNIIAQIASALDAAHARGLIHGDVKPANILLETSDTAGEVTAQRAVDYEPGHAYLADFGMSTALPPDQIVATTAHLSKSKDTPSTAGLTSTHWPVRRSSCSAVRRPSGKSRARP
jgi:serine/threonine protein kinase